MKKGEIVFSLFLPTNQDPTGAIKPTMSAFHYPSPCAITGGNDFLLLLHATTANMWDVVAGLNLIPRWCSIVACIQAEVLRLPLNGFGTGNHNAIQGSTQQFPIMTVSPVN